MMKRKHKSKWLWIGLGLLLAVLVLGVLVFNRFGEFREQRLAQLGSGDLTGDVVTAFVGDLSASASASGQVLAQRDAVLALSGSGKVSRLYVEVGDWVQEGEPLLALETADLERDVESARRTVTLQETNLAGLLEPASAWDLAAAEAAVASAQANLQELLEGPSAEKVAGAEADLRAAQGDIGGAAARLSERVAGADAQELRAAEIELALAQEAAVRAAEQHSAILVTEPEGFLSEERLADMELAARSSALQANAALAEAQDALDRLVAGDPDAIAAARAGLAQAQAQGDAAQARLDLLLEGSSGAQIAAARASLAQAEANLDRLRRGPSNLQRVAAEVALEQARINLNKAENRLAQATLLAPFDGVVTSLHVGQGEQAAGVVVEMVDTASLQVVLEVDQVDIGAIEIGQAATITLETWPDQEIQGEVVSIALQATGAGGVVVSYQVYLSLGESDLPIRTGMTANASLITMERQDVLLVPSSAIKTDRSAGTYSVNRVTTDLNGNPLLEQRQVSVGLRDNAYTEIVSGLQSGDQVAIGEITPGRGFGLDSSSRMGPGRLFGGGN